ncbi:hypothetical protein CF165_38450 [Amycolatopsis vastitatis]|uniref:Uncharacterized protein n=1 Tax=Amycolatopsis vastitatis TaxID=1905142 RepID=A0A229SRR7_9PSEU|nr:hypothetical protein CF165_38450 [Amycolatopsis vastitatis]
MNSERLPGRIVNLLADPETGERLLQMTRWLVVGTVLVVAIAGAVLIAHPQVLTEFASSPANPPATRQHYGR